MDAVLKPVLAAFGLTPLQVSPLGGGLINDTYHVMDPGQPGVILQRVNTTVFQDPVALMENLMKVLPVLEGPGYHPTELLKTAAGEAWVWQPESGFWRAYLYIPNSRTYENTTDPALAREAGRILGQFHNLLDGVPARELHTPMPGFHDLEKRARELQEAVSQGGTTRKSQAAPWLEVAGGLIDACREIPFDTFPLRVCHNDPVLKNILYRKDRPQALCLIDLDTLMPGVLIWDFGDAVRSVVCAYPEDYGGEGPMQPDLDAFAAFADGFLGSGVELTESEREWLPWGLVLMPLLHGIRALADYLAGDVYYKVSFPEQNLVRAKNLLELARASQEALPELYRRFSAA